MDSVELVPSTTGGSLSPSSESRVANWILDVNACRQQWSYPGSFLHAKSETRNSPDTRTGGMLTVVDNLDKFYIYEDCECSVAFV